MSFWGGYDDLTTGGLDMSGMYGASPGNTLTIPSVMPPSYPIASAGAPASTSLPSGVGSLADYLAGAGGGGGGMAAPYPSLSGTSGAGGGLGSLLGLGGFGGAGAGNLLGGGGMNPMLLAMLLGGGGKGGAAGAGSLLPYLDLIGALENTGSDIFSLASNKPGGGWQAGLEQGLMGALQGGVTGFEFGGPIGAGVGALVEGLLGGLAGSGALYGLPKMAKPQGFASALTASQDPLQALLGNYVQKYGISKGYDLSEPFGSVPFNASYMGDVLQLLSGEQFPALKGGLLTPQGQTGYQHPVGLPVSTLQKLQSMFPNEPTLGIAQMQSIMPEMAALVGRAHGKDALQNLLGQEETLAGKLRAAETY